MLVKSISLTTRPRRSGEKDRKDYFFVSADKFLALRSNKKILEWTKYLGYYYATPKDFIDGNLKRGNNIVLCLDLKGALKLKRLYPLAAVTVFIIPPSLGVLKNRIINRCRKTGDKEVKERLGLAKKELLEKDRYDHYVVNKDLPLALARLKKIVLSELDKQKHSTRSG